MKERLGRTEYPALAELDDLTLDEFIARKEGFLAENPDIVNILRAGTQHLVFDIHGDVYAYENGERADFMLTVNRESINKDSWIGDFIGSVMMNLINHELKDTGLEVREQGRWEQNSWFSQVFEIGEPLLEEYTDDGE